MACEARTDSLSLIAEKADWSGVVVATQEEVNLKPAQANQSTRLVGIGRWVTESGSGWVCAVGALELGAGPWCYGSWSRAGPHLGLRAPPQPSPIARVGPSTPLRPFRSFLHTERGGIQSPVGV